MQRIFVPALAWIGLAVLCLVCIRCHGPRIQEDLTRRGGQRLAEAGLDPALLQIHGRDATLTGSAESEDDRARAARAVAATWGVRSVNNRLTVAAAASGAALDRSVETRRIADKSTPEGQRMNR